MARDPLLPCLSSDNLYGDAPLGLFVLARGYATIVIPRVDRLGSSGSTSDGNGGSGRGQLVEGDREGVGEE